VASCWRRVEFRGAMEALGNPGREVRVMFFGTSEIGPTHFWI
jgi:hypothetical protein